MTIAASHGSTVRIELPGGMHPTAAAADAVLAATANFLDTAGDDVYTRPCAAFHSGTIGQHVRHLLDHVAAALAGVGGSEIDYDHRRRDTPIETSRSAALREIESRRAEARGVTPAVAHRPAAVRVMLSAEGAEAVLGSTIGRELAFATHHAIHHHAMISAIAGAFGLTPPPGFGKAPATLRHERHSHPGPTGH